MVQGLSKFWLAIGVAAMGLCAPHANAVTYPTGFVWDRSDDWTPGTTVGTTAGNPDTDRLGTPVWRYEYTQGGGGLGSANPWYLQPKTLMIWDNWNPVGPAPEQLWTRADNLEPKINRYNMSHSRSQRWNSWDYQAMVRWINPLGDGALVNIGGSLRVEWGGWGVSPDVPVDVIIGFKDASANTFSLVLGSTVNNPLPGSPNPPYPSVTIPLNFKNLRVDAGDSFLISVRAQSAPSALDSWIIMYDDVKISYVAKVAAVATVPEPSTATMGLIGLVMAGGIVALRRCKQAHQA